MIEMHNYIVTGATSGLGLEAIRKLVERRKTNMILVGVRNPDSADDIRKAVPAEQLQIFQLDTSSIQSVKRFAAEVRSHLGTTKLAGLALNAGIQVTDADRQSVDGYELTFATNVLGHIILFDELEGCVDDRTVVVSTASGTHDPEHPLAAPYGFKGGVFPSAQAVAVGAFSDESSVAQRGRDRYSTSKLCNVMFSYAMARRFGQAGPRFIAFDPGLMPGTGLARTQSAPIRFAWRFILPLAVRFIKGASTAQRSGAELARLLVGEAHPSGSGLHVEYSGASILSSQLSYDEHKQDALIDWVAKLEHQIDQAA